MAQKRVRVCLVLVVVLVLGMGTIGAQGSQESSLRAQFDWAQNTQVWPAIAASYCDIILKGSQVPILFTPSMATIKSYQDFQTSDEPSAIAVQTLASFTDEKIDMFVYAYMSLLLPTTPYAALDMATPSSLQGVTQMVYQYMSSQQPPMNYALDEDQLKFMRKVFPSGWYVNGNDYDNFRYACLALTSYLNGSGEVPDSFKLDD